MCNSPHLRERRNSETPGTIDINGENAIIRLEANVRERAEGKTKEEINAPIMGFK
jgi:hypothetical protein